MIGEHTNQYPIPHRDSFPTAGVRWVLGAGRVNMRGCVQHACTQHAPCMQTHVGGALAQTTVRGTVRATRVEARVRVRVRTRVGARVGVGSGLGSG